MRNRGGIRSVDLVATIAAAVIGVGLSLFVRSGPLATATLLPLVLILPGYALSAAMFPPGAIGRDLRLVLTVALSIGTTALGGLLVQLATELNRSVFVALLATVTILAAGVALIGRDRTSDDRLPRLDWARLPVTSIVAIAAAVSISGLAIAIASAGAKRQLDASHFSALWLVPQGRPGVPSNRPPVAVGVSNHEGRQVGYQLRIHQGARNIGVWRFRLKEGGEWNTTLPASALRGAGVLVAYLFSAGKPDRRVSLELDSGSGATANA